MQRISRQTGKTTGIKEKGKENTKFNWGIIGRGNIAKDFINDLQYVSTPQRVIAVLSHREESAKECAVEHQVEGWYTDLQEFLNHERLDAVYIATPHTAHFEQALACLQMKKPV